MSATRRGQALDSSRAQRIDVPRQLVPSSGPRPASGLVSQWLGPRMPARRASPPSHASDVLQRPPAEALALARQRDAHRQEIEIAETDRKPRSKQDFLTFFDEWMSEPDEMGEEWWARFDEELKANRLHFPERELP